MNTTKIILAVLAAATSISSAKAQFPTQITPNGTGGWNVYNPNIGGFPTQITPNGTGGWNVYNPNR
jgi:hypothetical protein